MSPSKHQGEVDDKMTLNSYLADVIHNIWFASLCWAKGLDIESADLGAIATSKKPKKAQNYERAHVVV